MQLVYGEGCDAQGTDTLGNGKIPILQNIIPVVGVVSIIWCVDCWEKSD